MDREKARLAGEMGEGAGGGTGDRGSKQGYRTGDGDEEEEDAGYVLSRGEMVIETELLAFYEEIQRDRGDKMMGTEWGGEEREKERSQASLVSICSHRSHSYLWPHCR